ncbi:MAG: DUF2281 domain-containing protein, partial [Methanophagales archaeon]|nr:DUF2281 domain-containing protein [Methanophagales archaeon]
ESQSRASKKREMKMTAYEATTAKIRELPEPLIQEVSDFIDFLQMKSDSTRWQLWLLFVEALDIAESEFADYLPNLEDYENRLVRGEIKW